MSDLGTHPERGPLDIMNGLLRSTPSRRAIILGAGFSRAISGCMPMNDQLGNLAIARAGITDAPRFEGGRFEAWLSRLAEPQPDLSASANAANRARFLTIAEAIHEVILEAESEACAGPTPSWLHAFVVAAHFDQSFVITFNYDTLVETATQASGLGVPSQTGYLDNDQKLHWLHTYAGVPPSPPSWLVEGDVPTFRLLKLHGSVHWYWVTGDTTGATLHHASLSNTPEERRRYHPGRQPFIVPPAALKSSFLHNPVTSQIWMDAASGIERARDLDLVGYSLPLTDLTAAGMIGETVDRETAVTIANPDIDGSVAASVMRVIGREPKKTDGAAEFVEGFVADRSRQVVADLIEAGDELAPNALLQVGWNRQAMAAANRVSLIDETIEVSVAPFVEGTDRPIVVDDTQRAERIQTLVAACRAGAEIHAVFDDGSRSPIVGLERFGAMTGQSTHWQLLVPAHRPGEPAGS